jgi:capsular exopolysaccharide synthesis family protein
MSNIFDAFQRSQAERTGIKVSATGGATELLRIAEQEATDEPASPSPSETVVANEVSLQSNPVLFSPTPSYSREAALSGQDAVRASLHRFRSIQPSVTPQSRLVSINGEETLAAEKFRFVGVRLKQLQQSRKIKKVLVTSSIPQEGKSTVAANLACVLARRSPKTLLIDGDLRRPSVAALFGLGKIPGLCECLQGESTLTDNIYHLEEPGCHILPAGNARGNPLELMQSTKLPALLEQLAPWFDWVVIDSPPVLPLGDTSIWMRLVDGILLVARQGVSEKNQLKKGLEQIEGSKLLGAVLNGAATIKHYHYYYHYTRPTSGKGDPSDK